ncbi:unnamed protein product [Spirodela intermedia]|uniref:Uncharacterized protein ycf68 n=1 Tax=Spirodela intermedia TaxID=51605 RepID=A0ABN7ECL2_SPIIN|nr:unnamed protein product [Spirodela intermedia]
MDSSMCSSAPDPEMWIIQGTLAWRTPPVRSNVDPTLYSLVGSGRSGGGPTRLLSSRESIHPLSVYGQLSLEHRFRFGLNGKMEHLTTHLHRPRTTRSPLSFWGLEKAAINRISLILPSRREERLKKDLRVSRVGPGGFLTSSFFFHRSFSQRLAMVRGKGGTSKAHLSLVQVQDGPAAPGKRIEEASDSFMHAPLGLGGIYNGEEDRNMPLKDSTETKMGCQERREGRMGSWSDLVWIVHGP